MVCFVDWAGSCGPFFGHVSWSAPTWAPATGAAIKRKPRQFAGGFFIALLVIAAAWLGWQWYQHRPRPIEPERISFEAKTPAVTDYLAQPDGTPKITIHPLDIAFSGSAAPIELVGKPVTKGINMRPALKGAWTWTDDHTLRFVPAEDWPVGAHIEVRFDVTDAFAPHVLMADDRLAVDLPAFSAKLGNGEFYQDPQDPTAKTTIVPVNFNYPVDTAQFEKRIAIALADKDGKPGTPMKFTVTYDAFKLNAWVHSQPLDLPRDDSAVLLKLDSGVRSSHGGDGTPDALQARIRVPSLYSLTLQDISPTLVDNDKYEPEQVLVINASGKVRGSDLAGLTKAWVLPRKKDDVDSGR